MKETGYTGNISFYDYITLYAKTGSRAPIGSLAVRDASTNNVCSTLYVNIGTYSNVGTLNTEWKPLIHTLTTDTSTNLEIQSNTPGVYSINLTKNLGYNDIKTIDKEITEADASAAGWRPIIRYNLNNVNIDPADLINKHALDFVVDLYKVVDSSSTVTYTRIAQDHDIISVNFKNRTPAYDIGSYLEIKLDFGTSSNWKAYIDSGKAAVKGYYSNSILSPDTGVINPDVNISNSSTSHDNGRSDDTEDPSANLLDDDPTDPTENINS